MLNFCDFIQVYVFSTNHHLNKVVSHSCNQVQYKYNVERTPGEHIQPI